MLDGENGKIRPNDNITRAEAVSFLNRMFNRVADAIAIEGFENSLNYFNDLKKTDWFYYEILEASNSHELIRRDKSDKYKRTYEAWTKVFDIKNK